MLTPADIDSKQFTATRFKEGYDPLEVDAFLDLVIEDYRRFELTLASNQEEIARLKRLLKSTGSEAVTSVIPLPPPPPAASAERILVAAQRTADQVEAEANAEAGQIRASARAEAGSIKQAAEAERQTILNRLEGERAELEEKIQILKAKRANYKSWLRAALSKLEEEESNDA